MVIVKDGKTDLREQFPLKTSPAPHIRGCTSVHSTFRPPTGSRRGLCVTRIEQPLFSPMGREVAAEQHIPGIRFPQER